MQGDADGDLDRLQKMLRGTPKPVEPASRGGLVIVYLQFVATARPRIAATTAVAMSSFTAQVILGGVGRHTHSNWEAEKCLGDTFLGVRAGC